MTHSDRRTLRRALRREIAGTIGLLTDEHDFSAMRRYRSFTFHDHSAYLEHVEAVLRTRARQGSHTSVALFDPEDYADYCTRHGLDPDSPASRTRFTAELATTGPTVPYDGRPLADLLPTLVDEAIRQATWEYSTTLLSRLGACASCGEDLGRAAFTRAAHLLTRILDTAPPGRRHLVCNVSGPPEPLVAVLHADDLTDDPTGPLTGRLDLDEAEALEFTSVLAVGLATDSPGGLVMRTMAPGRPDRVYGWRLRAHTLEPLTAAEVFDAYCTDIETGDLIAPESNVDYCAPPDLGPGPDTPHHH
ncbi:hypothetical protein HCJ93_03050 [Streptomyces sp. SBST2-5]|uniref:Uncharacterized protein n=1 Tax=Streptomyces composti TaxID=2720025 RepID=A0ABX1A268_9ACTN|nr:hypothetical protein [Streptomyces composti]NJP49077.1 hypothetical protein [Streptomyces composti]